MEVKPADERDSTESKLEQAIAKYCAVYRSYGRDPRYSPSTGS